MSDLTDLLNRHRPDWMDFANCMGVDADLFFPSPGESHADANAVCNACQVKTQCLQYALDNGEKFGIWGGASEKWRRKVRRGEAPPGKPGRQPSPCGSEAAYRRHHRNREPACDICIEARAEARRVRIAKLEKTA